MKKPVVEVKVGQMWADNDSRTWAAQRCVEVVEDLGDKVRVRVWEEGLPLDRFTVISKRRMKPTSTGYRLLEAQA